MLELTESPALLVVGAGWLLFVVRADVHGPADRHRTAPGSTSAPRLAASRRRLPVALAWMIRIYRRSFRLRGRAAALALPSPTLIAASSPCCGRGERPGTPGARPSAGRLGASALPDATWPDVDEQLAWLRGDPLGSRRQVFGCCDAAVADLRL